MKLGVLLLLAPILSFGGSPRFSRLGDFDGKVEVQLHAADSWEPAVRNTPLPELSRIRAAASSSVEVELDEGSALRLSGDSLCELSDYLLLSTGQRITLISVDHGLAYLTGEPQPHDTLSVSLPGAQVTFRQGSRIRVEAAADWSQVAVIEGAVRFSTPTAEMDLREGQTARIELAAAGRFALFREIPHLDTDTWSEQRDKALAGVTSLRYVPFAHFGLLDLDRSGVWLQTGDYGPAWKPKVGDDWAPFRDGKWHWYNELGYTWVSNEAWGWAPYHYGRWLQDSSLGWIWVPGKSAAFKPGEVYWARGTNFTGWGPLGPEENWTASGAPRMFSLANSTFAKFAIGMRELDPATVPSKPKDMLAFTSLVIAPPSPPLAASRLDAIRPPLRTGGSRAILLDSPPSVPGASYQEPREVTRAEPPPPAAPDPNLAPPVRERIVESTPPPEPVYEPDPVYAVPVYTGIVVVNPPQRDHRHRGTPNSPAAAQPTPQPAALLPTPAAATAPGIHREHPGDHPHSPPAAAPTPQPIFREHPGDRRPEHPAPAAPPAASTFVRGNEVERRPEPKAVDKTAEKADRPAKDSGPNRNR